MLHDRAAGIRTDAAVVSARETRALPMHCAASREAYENIACPLCGGNSHEYSQMGEYYIDRCDRCQFFYVRNVPSDRYLADYYQSYCGPDADRYIPERRWHKKLKNWWFAKRIGTLARAGGRVLEIGYAHGNLLKALQRDGRLQVEGIDYSTGPLAHLRSMGLNVSVSSLEDKHYPDRHFDVVVGLHVLEHVHNPIRFISEVHRILTDRGRIYIQVPCPTYWRARLAGKRWKAFGPPGHLWYFSPKSIRIFLSKYGFRVVSAHCLSHRAHLTVVAERQ
jgi:SAM-dependent methyltransferase